MKTYRISLVLAAALAVWALSGSAWEAQARPIFGGSSDTTIYGLAVEEPASGDDGKYLYYDHATTSYLWGTPAGGGDMTEAVWDGDTDGFIDADAGGTDADSSGWTGIVQTSAGAWSASNTLAANLTLDDGSGDSPSIILQCAGDKTLTVWKDDDGHAGLANSEGAINLYPSNDSDDYLTFSTASNIPQIDTAGGTSLYISADGGDIVFAPDGDDDDRIVISTAANVPQITTDGGANLNINADGGAIDFGNENLTTTGTLAAGATTVTGNLVQKVDADAYLTISTTNGGGTSLIQTSDGTDSITIGDDADLVIISAGNWDVDSAGAISGTTITVTGKVVAGSGAIQVTDATGNLDGTKVADADLGDVVVSSGVFTVEDLTIASEAQGDILYFDGSNWVRLAAGVSGQYLQTQGAAANPQWSSAGVSGDIEAVGNVTSGAAFAGADAGNTLYFEGATPNEYEIILTAEDASGADFTITLPAETGTVMLGPSDLGTDNILVRTNGTGNLVQATGISVADTTNFITVATSGAGIALDTDPADAGTIRLPNAASIQFEASPAGTDVNALAVDALEWITIGSAGASGVTVSPTVVFSGGITNAGTISAGTWQGTAVADSYVADDITLSNITQITSRSLDDVTDGSSYQRVASADVNASGHVDILYDSDGTGAVQVTGPTATRALTIDDAAQTLAARNRDNTFTENNTFGNADTDTLTVRSLIVGGNSRAVWIAGSAPSPTYATGTNELYVGGDIEAGGNISEGGTLLSGKYQGLNAYLTDISAMSATIGDIMYFDGSDWVILDAGTNGHFLQAQGAAAPAWAEGSSTGVNETYGSGWNGDTAAPEKDDVYDYLHQMDPDDGGTVDLDELGNPGANKSLTMGAYTLTLTSSTDGWGGMILANTAADNASGTTLFRLQFNDDFDTDSTFIHCINDADSGADTVLKVSGLGVYVGAGTPGQTMTGDDVYVSGFLEVDGAIYADGGIIAAAADDGYIHFDPATASESEWWVGPNHDAGGDDNDNLEFRQSATPGTAVAMYVTPGDDLWIMDDLALDSDAAVISLGAYNEVTLTHVADTGVLLNSTMQLQFGDSGTYINQADDGHLDLTADTSIDLNGATVITGHFTPSAADTYNLGSGTSEFANVYLGDGGGIYFQNDQSVYLTASASTLTLTGTMAVSAAAVPSAADGAALGSATNEWAALYLHDGAVIYGQADQSATLTSSASLWTANNLASSGYFAVGADPADAGAIRLANAAVIAWEDGTETTLTHVDDTGLTLNATFQATTLTDGTANINSGAITGVTSLTAGTSIITPLIDAAGDEDMDYGSADVDDHTFTSDGGTVILDGTIAASGGITTGANGADGQLTIYSEQGETDYSVVIQPHGTMTAATTYLLPPAVGTANQVLGIASVDGTTATLEWQNDDSAGSTAWDDIGNPDADDTISTGGYELTLSSTLNEADHSVLTIIDTTADITADSYLLSLEFNDAADEDAFYVKMVSDADGTPVTQFSVSGTGINSTLNFATTGTILGAVNIVTTTDGSESPTAAQMYGTMFIADHATATSDTTYTLPAAAAGMAACFYDNGAGTGGIIVNPDDADYILLNGTAMAAGEAAHSPGVAGDGANGDFVCIVALDDTYWITLGMSGTWVEETP